jgi:hypothetical protein
MNMKWFKRGSRSGTKPAGYVNIVLHPSNVAQYFYQEKQNWTWAPAPAHETRGALTNAWMGNQLPGPTNFIPNVPLSNFTWNVPTSYPNALLKNVQYNKGFNIGGYSAIQNATLQAAIQQAWQNRANG